MTKNLSYWSPNIHSYRPSTPLEADWEVMDIDDVDTEALNDSPVRNKGGEPTYARGQFLSVTPDLSPSPSVAPLQNEARPHSPTPMRGNMSMGVYSIDSIESIAPRTHHKKIDKIAEEEMYDADDEITEVESGYAPSPFVTPNRKQPAWDQTLTQSSPASSMPASTNHPRIHIAKAVHEYTDDESAEEFPKRPRLDQDGPTTNGHIVVIETTETRAPSAWLTPDFEQYLQRR